MNLDIVIDVVFAFYSSFAAKWECPALQLLALALSIAC
jgi:hypothetical protein